MKDWFLLYLLTRVDAVSQILCGAFSVCVIAAGFIFVWRFFGEDLDRYEGAEVVEKRRADRAARDKKVKPLLICAALFASTATFIPSRNDIIFIAGGTALIEIAKSDKAKSIGSKTLDVVEKYLDEAVKEPGK